MRVLEKRRRAFKKMFWERQRKHHQNQLSAWTNHFHQHTTHQEWCPRCGKETTSWTTSTGTPTLIGWSTHQGFCKKKWITTISFNSKEENLNQCTLINKRNKYQLYVSYFHFYQKIENQWQYLRIQNAIFFNIRLTWPCIFISHSDVIYLCQIWISVGVVAGRL